MLIVCRHFLSVLTLERVKELSSKYILDKWNKKVKQKHSYIKSSYDVAKFRPRMKRFDKLCKHFYDVADSDEATNLLYANLDGFKSSWQSMPSLSSDFNKTSVGKDLMSNLDDSCEDQVNEIHNPSRVTCKCRPPMKRKLC